MQNDAVNPDQRFDQMMSGSIPAPAGVLLLPAWDCAFLMLWQFSPAH